MKKSLKKQLIRFLATLVALWVFTDPAVESAFLTGPWSFRLPAPASLNAWVANFNQRDAAFALKNYVQHLQELSVFGVGGDHLGRLAPEQDFINAALRAARKLKSKPRILVTVANNRRYSTGDRRLLRQWIGSPEKRKKHIQDLMRLVQKMDGVDIDYENLRPSDSRDYMLFVHSLAKALHAKKKYLSITVEPSALLHGRINWSDMSEQADRIRVMAYPFHYAQTRPGAISPPDTVRRLVTRALQQIPASKLEIALPLYGYDWSKGGRTKLVATVAQYQQLTRRTGARVFHDRETQSARIDYSIPGRQGRPPVQHEVWFEDPGSLAYKVQILQQMGISHIGVWQLGVGDISGLFELVKVSPPAHP